jgi:hypothetical protein
MIRVLRFFCGGRHSWMFGLPPAAQIGRPLKAASINQMQTATRLPQPFSAVPCIGCIGSTIGCCFEA